MENFTAWMNALNGIVWGPAMLVLILGTGLYLQVRLFGMPIRRIGAGLRLAWRRRNADPSPPREVRPLPALAPPGGCRQCSNNWPSSTPACSAPCSCRSSAASSRT